MDREGEKQNIGKEQRTLLAKGRVDLANIVGDVVPVGSPVIGLPDPSGKQWVLAVPRGRSIIAAEQVAGLCRRGMRDVA